MATMKLVILVAALLGASVWMTQLVRQAAMKRGLLDHPNARSSHVTPTPRGGGLAIVVVTSVGMLILFLSGFSSARLLLALLVGGGAVALAGYLDDRGVINIATRLAIHVSAAILAVVLVGGLTELDFGNGPRQLGLVGPVLSVLGIVWTLNLFNFMDGIDGIAASEAVFVAGAGAALTSMAGATSTVPLAATVFAAAALGFLYWNRPPARVFMGDVGSGYLGFCLAVFALAAGREEPAHFNAWLILSAVFIVDATITLIRRLVRGERVYEAHRSHAYQWLARRWGSHARVTLAVCAVNLAWLAPCAWACLTNPRLTKVWLILALIPLAFVCLVAGSGRRER